MLNNVIKGLGEIVMRVQQMEPMERFYGQTLGLPVLRKREGFVFFKLGNGYGGHSQILGLFEANLANAFGEVAQEVDTRQGPLHHFAFEIDLDNYEQAIKALEADGVVCKTQTFAWAKWRSVFFKDPEGNVVELVCYDKSLIEED